MNTQIRQERKELIDGMVAKRITYQEIGNLLGLSRQRVHQIATGYKSPYFAHPKNYVSYIKEVYPSVSIKQSENLSITKLTGMGSGSRDRIRELVRIRDNHTCQMCLKIWQKGNRRFDVHHTDEKMEGKSKEKGTCKSDRENMDKMITLCHKCHLNLDSVRRKMSVASRKILDKK